MIIMQDLMYNIKAPNVLTERKYRLNIGFG